MKYQGVRHDIAIDKLRKAEETDEDAKVDIEDAISQIEIDLKTITQKED